MTLIIESVDTDVSGTTLPVVGGDIVHGTLSLTDTHDGYRISVVAGQCYTVSLVGIGVGSVQDTGFSVYNPAGTELFWADDELPSLNSNLTFTALENGDYFIDVYSYGESSAGNKQYGLSVDNGTISNFDAAMGAGVIDASSSWSAVRGAATTITYAFRQTVGSPAATDAANQPITNFEVLTGGQEAAVQTALQMYSEVAGLTFQQTAPGGHSDDATMLFGSYQANDGAGAFAYLPGSRDSALKAGDVWINRTSFETEQIPLGGYEYFALVHEIGHAMGLLHPGMYNASLNQVLTYENSAQFVQDSRQYSLMSYFDESNTIANGASYLPIGASGYLFGYATTLLMFDILALQNKYGVNYSTRSGDSTYGFNSDAGAAYSFSSDSTQTAFCIWDGGGTDTLDLTGFSQNQTISLLDGTFSSVGGLTSNLSIAVGATIENAKGGSGNDSLTGNDATNQLVGGAGNDTLDGGAGSDTAMFSGNAQDYTVTANYGDQSITVECISGNDGIDILYNLEVLSFLDTSIYKFALFNSDAICGDDSGNELDGTEGNDSIYGFVGNDTLSGGAGDDLIDGGLGFDIASYELSSSGVTVSLATVGAQNTVGAGTDTLTSIEGLRGSAFDDSLAGDGAANSISAGDGNDTLDGNAGTDTMFGGAGDDTFIVDSVTDVVTEDVDGGTDKVQSSASYTLAANVDNLTLTGSAAINGTGNTLDNILIGNAGANVLTGGAGLDTASYASAAAGVTVNLAVTVAQNTVGAGTDTLASIENLIGTVFADSLTGSSVANRIDGGAANDTINGGAGADTLDGGEGSDLYVVTAVGDKTTAEITDTGESGSDELRLSAAAAGTFTLLAGDTGLERVVIGTGIAATAVTTATTALSVNAAAVVKGLTMIGNSGVNALTGTAFADSLDGGAGNDTLVGGADNDTLTGAAGNDVLTGGDGTDTASYGTSTAAVTVNLALTVAQNTGGGGTDTLTGIENLIGTGLNDTLTGSSGVNRIDGGAGNDMIAGAAGADILDGSQGSDIYVLTAFADKTVSEITDSGTSGVDEFRLAATVAGTLTLFAGDTGLERVVIGTGTGAAAVATGTTALNINASAVTNGLSMVGNAGANTLTGTAFADGLEGSAGNDTLFGDAGNDTLTGGSGIDGLNGGADSDLYILTALADKTVAEIADNGLTGVDELRFAAVASGTLTLLAGDTGLERVVIGTGTGASAISTATTALNVNAAAVTNGLTITGNAGVNTLNGTGSADRIEGAGGNDVLNGGVGNDTLVGGAGNDALTGGTGSDVFLFDVAPSATTNRDTIADFVGAQDDIWLSRAVMTGLGPNTGALSADAFRSGAGITTAGDATDHVIYNTTTGGLYYDVDGSGGSAAVQFALVTGAPSLAFGDFLIV